MNIILGAGLTGLTAAYVLTRAGQPVVIIEKSCKTGGLARTIRQQNFLFDLGGHRFMTDDAEIATLLQELLGDELLTVPRRSQIYMAGKFFDYPLKPFNAMCRLGLPCTVRILTDFWFHKIKAHLFPAPVKNLEDWVVNQFGRTMFELYFKDYSEKVWGMNCRQISSEWVAARINGLSLWQTVKNSLTSMGKKKFKTLTDSFFYPRHGIGRIAERFEEEIHKKNPVLCSTELQVANHNNGSITSIEVINEQGRCVTLKGDHFISTIPLTTLIRSLRPLAPLPVRQAALRMSYRDLVIVTLMVDKAHLTDLTWMYLPEKTIPFGRIHEPKNWSAHMAPSDKTHVVAEYFCSKDDAVWRLDSQSLIEKTVEGLERVGLLDAADIIDGCVVRVPNAYPVFSTGYQEMLKIITAYLKRFSNLDLAGRTGAFSYLNMDQAMAAGLEAAKKVAGERLTVQPDRISQAVNY